MNLPDPTKTAEISVNDAFTIIDSQEVNLLLIDCREPDEFEICHLEGSELVPLSNFEVESETLFVSEEENALIYCHHGGRSLQATQYLRSKGYKNVFSIEGGIDKWAVEIDDSLARY